MPRLLSKLRSSPCYRLHSELIQFDASYAFSISDTRQFLGQILQDVFESCPTSEVDSVAERWTELGHELITTDKKPFQRYWSSAVHKALLRFLIAGAPPSRLANILTAAQGQSADWITAYQIAQVGTRLDDEALRISVALRSVSMSALHTSVDVGLLSSQTAFIHFHDVSVLVDLPDTSRSTTS